MISKDELRRRASRLISERLEARQVLARAQGVDFQARRLRAVMRYQVAQIDARLAAIELAQIELTQMESSGMTSEAG